MYFHPLAQAAARQHYAPKVFKDSTGGQRDRFVGDSFLVQSHEVRTVAEMKLIFFDGRRPMLVCTSVYSLVAYGAVTRVATLACTGDDAKETEMYHVRMEPKRVRERAKPTPTDGAAEVASRPDTSQMVKRGRSQRWLVDPRVG